MKQGYILAAVLILSAAGCAKLKVTKISEDSRLCGTDDHVKGFRYYLSRPYVVVTKPVLVSETSALYLLTSCELQKMQAVKLNPSSGNFVAVDEAELKQLRKLASNDKKVCQASHHKKAEVPAPPVLPMPEILPPATEQTRLVADSAADQDAAFAVNQSSAVVSDGAADAGTNNGHLSVPQITGTPGKTVSLNGSIQVVFLPDLDEQYAVHNKNFLSKSAYNLKFQDGWSLSDVSGEFDSTAVPLQILNFIDSAISAAKAAATADVSRMAERIGDETFGRPSIRAADDSKLLYRVVTSTYLQPGVYRINKPWEVAEQTEVCGAGFLAGMGLATYEVTRVEAHRSATSLLNAIAVQAPCPCGSPLRPCPPENK